MKRVALFALALALAATPVLAQTANPVNSGGQTCSTSAQQLPSRSITQWLTLRADKANSGTVYVGGSAVTAGTGYPLSAGDLISYGVTNASSVWFVCANTTDVLHWSGN